MRKVVVYMGDRRIYDQLIIAAKSLLAHTTVDHVYFLIDTPTFPEPLPDIITTINVHNQNIFPVNGPNYHPHYGYMTWMRTALSKIFPSEDVVLLLDPDTIVVDDISPMWDYDLSDYYLAAVKETRFYSNRSVHDKDPYFNAGVMLMNLAKLRADHIDDTLIQSVNAKHYKHLEQDVINLVCDKHILALPSEYNTSFVTDITAHPRIRHFLSLAKDEYPEWARKYERIEWNDILQKGANHHAEQETAE